MHNPSSLLKCKFIQGAELVALCFTNNCAPGYIARRSIANTSVLAGLDPGQGFLGRLGLSSKRPS